MVHFININALYSSKVSETSVIDLSIFSSILSRSTESTQSKLSPTSDESEMTLRTEIIRYSILVVFLHLVDS